VSPQKLHRNVVNKRGCRSRSSAGRSRTLADKPPIAVLRFQNMSGDLEQEYLADGVVEDIIAALAQARRSPRYL
jgi:adenylate cyclase